MSNRISRDELKGKIDRGDAFLLFEVLPLPYYRKHHLPGAMHLPPEDVADSVARLAPDKNAEIVTYCWDEHCPTSPYAARVLESLGYTKVREYVEGKKDWRAAGLPLERTDQPRAPSVPVASGS